MSKFDGRNGVAVGLVLGISLTLTFALWVSLSSRLRGYHDSYAQCESDYEKSCEKLDVITQWDGVVGLFISPSDTLAQWIMALFTIGAVFLVWRTLISTKSALEVTQQMALDQRRIGEAQTRAYISIKDVGFDVGEGFDGANIKIEYENVGETPAKDLQVKYELQVTPYGLSAKSFFKGKHFSPRTDFGKGQKNILEIGGVTNLPAQWHLHFLQDIISFQATGIITYRDIFGKRHFTTFRMLTLRKDKDNIRIVPSQKGNKSN